MSRFREVISTQEIIDTEENKKYHGLVDDELVDLMNELNNENQRLKDIKETLEIALDDKYSKRVLEVPTFYSYYEVGEK